MMDWGVVIDELEFFPEMLMLQFIDGLVDVILLLCSIELALDGQNWRLKPSHPKHN